MKSGKPIVVILVFSVCFILLGTLYRALAVDFNGYYHQEFGGISKGEYEARFTKLIEVLENNQIDAFVVGYEESENGTSTINIYCRQKIKEYLEDHEGKYEGEIASPFAKSVFIKYHDLFDFNEIENVRNSYDMYFLYDGDLSSVELDELGDFSPDGDGNSTYYVFLSLYRCIWIAALIITFGVTCILLYFGGREIMIRMCYGYSFKRLVGFALAREIGTVVILPILVGYVLRKFWVPLVDWRFFLGAWIVFIVLDIAACLFGYTHINYRKALNNTFGSRKVLMGCYLIRVIMLIICVASVSVFARTITDYLDILRQRTFFKPLEGYAEVRFHCLEAFDMNLSYDERWQMECESLNKEKQIYSELYNASEKALILFNGYFYFEEGSCIVVNETAWDLYGSRFTDVGAIDDRSKNYLLISNELKNSEYLETEYLNEFTYYGEPEIIYCDISRFRVFGGESDDIDDNTGEEDIIMVYLDFRGECEKQNYGPWESILVGLSKSQVDEILQKYDEEGMYINMYEGFLERTQQRKNSALACLLLLMLLIAIDVMVTEAVVNLEHEINAMELLIKKISGTPLHVRYESVFMTSFTATLIGIIVAAFINNGFSVMLIITGLGFAALELVITAVISIKWENTQAVKILKGGAL